MKYKVPQLIPFVGKEELENLKQVIKKKWLTEGPFAEKFLRLIKEKTGAKYAVLANNGTLALYIALKAIGIKEDDEIIIPNFTFIASATSVHFAGATPVFVDINPDTLNIDVTQIEKLITKKTKAIMPVHVYGQAANMDPIIEIAKKYNLKIIEDAAQGYGVYYKGKHTGTIGDVGTISFFADKTVTTGEGAVILTNKQDIYESLLLLRNQGRSHSGTFIHPYLGMNFRMTDLQCAIGVAQLKKLGEILKAKQKNYDLYVKELKNIKQLNFIKIEDFSNFIPFRVNIKVHNKDGLMQSLEANGIQTRSFFFPLHRQPCFNHLNYKEKDFPNSNSVFEQGLSLPIFPNLKTSHIKLITDTIIKFLNR